MLRFQILHVRTILYISRENLTGSPKLSGLSGICIFMENTEV